MHMHVIYPVALPLLAATRQRLNPVILLIRVPPYELLLSTKQKDLRRRLTTISAPSLIIEVSLISKMTGSLCSLKSKQVPLSENESTKPRPFMISILTLGSNIMRTYMAIC